MAEEKKQQTAVGLLERADTQQERVDESYDESLIDAPERPPQKHTSSTETPRPARKKKRPTKVEIDNRNRAVTAAAIEFQARHNRLPTAGEIAAETRYSRRQIYSTTPYKEGKITKNSSKSTSNMTGGSVGETGHYGGKSIQGPTATRRPERAQIELDALVEQQDSETKDVATADLIQHDSCTCYLCGCGISAKRNTGYKCPKCGNRACSSCLDLLMDTSYGACLICDSKANKLKAMSIAFVGIVIVVVIILSLVVI
jgi:hypothetical protein